MSVILKLYNAAGQFLQELPDYKNLKLQGPKDSPGGWSFDYPLDKPGFANLISDEDRTFTVTVNGTVLPFQGLIEEDSWDEIKPGDRVASLSGSDTSKLLDFGKVYPAGGLGTLPAEYTFNAQTPGYIVGTLMAQMQARGALSGITKNFTNTTDSSGAAWANTFTITFKQGVSLLEVVQGLGARNLFNWRMNGKQLQMYNPDTTLAADRTSVVFRRGKNLEDAPRKRSRKDLKTVILVEGDDGKTVERSDTAAVTARGRKEAYVSQGGTSDTGALSVIGDYHLQLYKQPRLSKSHNVRFSTGTMPWIDFFPGDYVYTDITGTNEKYRLVDFAMSVTGTESLILGEVVLNDKFDELETQLQNKLDAFQSGIDKGGDSTPTKETPDVLAPSAPTGLQINSDAYTDNAGILRALMYAGWNPPTTNSDGSVLFDLQDYEFQWRYGTGQSRRNIERNPNWRNWNAATTEFRRNRILNPMMRATGGSAVIRTNLATNPSSEAAAWPSNNGTIYPTSADTTVKRSGTQSTKSTPVTGQSALASIYNVGCTNNTIPCAAGEYYAVSVYFAHNAAVTASAAVTISWLDSTGTQISTTVGTAVGSIVGNSQFTARPYVVGQAPAGCTQFRVVASASRSTGTVLTGEFCWFDDALIEKVLSPNVTPSGYFSGASATSNGLTYAWSGPANASTSTATGSTCSQWQSGVGSVVRVDLGNGKYAADFRNSYVNYSNASTGAVGEFFSGKVMVCAIPGETPAGATVQVRIYDGSGYLASADAFYTIPSDGSALVIDTVGNAAATNTSPRMYLYSTYPFRLLMAQMEKVPATGIPVLDFFNGTAPYKNLAPGSYATLGNGTTVTPNVSFGGKKWTRIKHPNGGYGARMNVNLSDLQNGLPYTVSATVYNESDSTVLIGCEWVDGGSQGESGGFFILQPRETRRIWGTNTRAIYDSIYRFHDIEFGTTTFDGSILITDVLIEYGSINHNFWAGTLNTRDGLIASWVGTADNSESILSGRTVTYASLAYYTEATGVYGWPNQSTGYHIICRGNNPVNDILGFDAGGGSTEVVVNRWYAGRMRLRSVNNQTLSVRLGLATYTSVGGNFNNWLNDGVVVSLPASGEWVDISAPAKFVAAANSATIRWLLYANQIMPANAEIEIEKSIVTEVAGAGYVCSQYFDGSTPSTTDFLYTWAGPKDNSFSDKTIRSVKDNNWRSQIVKDPAAFVSDVIPGALVDVQVRARDTHGHVSVWATGFGALDSDSYGPPSPSTPQLSSKLGVITVYWNGLGSSGEQMPPDFDRLEIHMSNASGFTPDSTTYQGFMQKSGAYVITGQTGGETRYFKFIAVDLSGNQSEASNEVSVVVNRIKGPDIEANTVTTNELSVGAVEAENIGLGVLATNLIRDPSFEDPYEVVDCDPNGSYGVGDFWRWRREALVAGEAITKTAVGRSRSGKFGCSLTSPIGGDAAIISPPVKVEAGKTYKFTVYATGFGGQAQIDVQIGFGTVAGDPGSVNMLNNTITLTPDTDYVAPPITTDPVNPDSFISYSWKFTPAAGQEYVAFRISNHLPTAASTLVVDDVSCLELGVGATELTSAGIRLFDEDGNEVGAFVSNRPNYFSVSNGGQTVAAISANGEISGQELTVQNDPQIQGIPLIGKQGNTLPDIIDFSQDPVQNARDYTTDPLGIIEQYAKGVVAWTQFSGSDIGWTVPTGGEAGLFEFGFDMEPGRHYSIVVSPMLVSTGGLTITGIRLRGTLDGSIPSLSSTIMAFDYHYAGGSNNISTQIAGRLVNGGATTQTQLRVLVCLYSSSNIANVYASQSVTAWIEDLGATKTKTGTARGYISGGTTGSTTQAVRSYSKTYRSTSSATYQGGGAKRSDTSDVVQGYNSYNGNGKGLWIFPSMTADLAGATVTKVEVYAYANHWYYNAGGTARIYVHGYSSAPGSSPSMTYAIESAGWPQPGGRWVTLPSSFYAGFKSGTYRGFGMGPAPSNSLTYYGRFNGGTASLIRVTYSK